MSKIWWQLLASPVLLGSQWVNPCLPSPMHDWAAEAAKHDPASSLNTVSHQSALRNIMFRSREWSTCLLNWEKNIWLFICHITEHCQIGWSILLFIDLRSAQVYCVAIFLVSQEVSLNFHRCCGKKLWVGWVGRGYTEISRYFPASWINWVTLVTKIKLLYSLRF